MERCYSTSLKVYITPNPLANIAKNIPGYNYSTEDFILKRRYNISNEIFEFRKIKQNKKFLFLSTEIPCLLCVQKESPNISNFNIKECLGIVNLYADVFVFIFNGFISIGGLSNNQSQNIITKGVNKQISNIRSLPGGYLTYVEEDKQSSLVLVDSNLNEMARYNLDHQGEEISTYTVIEGNKFIVGTAVVSNQNVEPTKGYIYIIELLENMKFKKLGEAETQGAVYKLAYSDRNIVLFVGIASCLYIYKIRQNFDIKMVNRLNDFILINDILCYDNFVVISDLCRSITILSYNDEKDKLTECCKDNSPSWNNAVELVSPGLYYTSDILGNICTFRQENQAKTDNDRYKLEKVAQFNLGERITKFHRVKKNISIKDYSNIYGSDEYGDCSLTITYFGTIDGSLGVLISLPREVYEYLLVLQNKILEKQLSTGNLDYSVWRSYKVK
jgi:hypothetical protein